MSNINIQTKPLDAKTPIYYDPKINEWDKPFERVNDEPAPWDTDEWLPVSFDCPWVECNPKTGVIKSFWPQLFVEECLLSDEYPDIMLGLQNGEQLVCYDSSRGVWASGENPIEWLVRLAAPTKATKKVVDETIAAARATMMKRPEQYNFTPDPWHIGFRNGILDLRGYYEAWITDHQTDPEQFLLDPDPSLHTVVSVPWELHGVESDKTCKEAVEYVEAFINRISSGNHDKSDQLYQAAASVLFGTNSKGSTLYWLHSSGSSGKSVYLGLLASTFSGLSKYNNYTPGTVSYLSVEGLGGRFETASLTQSVVNICNDCSSESFTKSGVAKLKSILSSEAIFVEKKNQQGFSIIPIAKLFMASNTLPKLSQKDMGGYAIERRTLIIPFYEKFEKGSSGFDIHIVDHLKKRPVVEAFLALLLPALCQYISQSFSVKQTAESKAAFTEAKIENDSVAQFFYENPAFDSADVFVNPWSHECVHLRSQYNGHLSTHMSQSIVWVYDIYKDFCYRTNRPACSEIMFTKHVSERFQDSIERSPGANLSVVSLDGVHKLKKRGWKYKDTALPENAEVVA